MAKDLRLEMIQLRMQRLQVAMKGCDVERAKEINREIEYLIDSVFDIREEEILARMNKRRRWWRRK